MQEFGRVLGVLYFPGSTHRCRLGEHSQPVQLPVFEILDKHNLQAILADLDEPIVRRRN